MEAYVSRSDLSRKLPEPLRRSLTWDQGSEMCHHHSITASTRMPGYFCHPGRPWQRPNNENTNGLLRNYFPKGTDLCVHTAADLARVAEELNPTAPQDAGMAHPTIAFRYPQIRVRVTTAGTRRALLGHFGKRGQW